MRFWHQEFEYADEEEDEQSVQCHVRDMTKEWCKANPDTNLGTDRMRRTFPTRRAAILTGTRIDDLLANYPFLQSAVQVCAVNSDLFG